LIKRTTTDLDIIKKRITNEVNSFSEKTENFAKDSDLLGAVEGILRLQKFYKLQTKNFAEGIFDGKKFSENLSCDDLFVIGTKAQELNEHYFAIEYLKLSLAKHDRSIVVDDVLFALARSYEKVGKLRKAIDAIEKIIENDPSKVIAFVIKEELESVFNQHEHLSLKNPNNETITKGSENQIEEEENFYRKACRGEIVKSAKEYSKLRCRFHSTNFFTKSARFTIKEISLKPNVLLFIDVLSNSEVDHLINISRAKTFRASTFDDNLKISNTRVAQVSWHNDDDLVVKRISRLIEDMTGLTTSTAEDLQIQNYGIGGHYALHWDHRLKGQPQFELGIGNRIAAILFYVRKNNFGFLFFPKNLNYFQLSDVEKSGSTVFPYLKVLVPAVKRSAFFWFNLKESGASEDSSRHAGCPVLIGSKWVANKWLHESGQNLTCDRIYH
jgi:prolyl 4-hydroxylase